LLGSIVERIGWERGLTVLKDRVRGLRPPYLPPDHGGYGDDDKRGRHRRGAGDSRLRRAGRADRTAQVYVTSKAAGDCTTGGYCGPVAVGHPVTLAQRHRHDQRARQRNPGRVDRDRAVQRRQLSTL
jgi:hypothetical protein